MNTSFEPAGFSRNIKKKDPKGVISISRRKPNIIKYDDVPMLSYSEISKNDPVQESLLSPSTEEL